MEIKILTKKEEVQAGIDLWNLKNPNYQIRPELIAQDIYAPYSGLLNIAIGTFQAKKMTGFVLIKHLTENVDNNLDKKQGWISLITAVADKYLESLLAEAEMILAARGIKNVRIGGDPQAFLPGLPVDSDGIIKERILQTGYAKESIEYDLYRDISSFKIPDKLKFLMNNDQLQAKRVDLTEEDELLNFLQEHFPGRWSYEAENIRRIPGGLADYWLLYKNNRAVAFARSNHINSAYQGTNLNWGPRFGDDYCGLGPIGVSNKERNNGYGLLLMTEIIKDFQQKKLTQMVIDWTDLVDYYQKLGFEPFAEYEIYRKEVRWQ